MAAADADAMRRELLAMCDAPGLSADAENLHSLLALAAAVDAAPPPPPPPLADSPRAGTPGVIVIGSSGDDVAGDAGAGPSTSAAAPEARAAKRASDGGALGDVLRALVSRFRRDPPALAALASVYALLVVHRAAVASASAAGGAGGGRGGGASGGGGAAGAAAGGLEAALRLLKRVLAEACVEERIGELSRALWAELSGRARFSFGAGGGDAERDAVAECAAAVFAPGLLPRLALAAAMAEESEEAAASLAAAWGGAGARLEAACCAALAARWAEVAASAAALMRSRRPLPPVAAAWDGAGGTIGDTSIESRGALARAVRAAANALAEAPGAALAADARLLAWACRCAPDELLPSVLRAVAAEVQAAAAGVAAAGVDARFAFGPPAAAALGPARPPIVAAGRALDIGPLEAARARASALLACLAAVGCAPPAGAVTPG